MRPWRSRSWPRSGTSPGSAPRRSWWPISGSTPGCASPVASRPVTGGSPRPAPRTPAACWSRRPGRPPRPPARCGRSTSGCRHGAECRSRWSRPRKIAVLCWHLIRKGEDYAYAQPSLVAHKRRKLELRAGLPAARGQKGKSAGYSLKAVRAAERDLVAQAEAAYRVTVATWQPRRPATRRAARSTPGTADAARLGVDVAATNGARLIQALEGQRGAAGLTAPNPALRDGVEPRPPPPEATPVLAGVKVVRPAGRSTLTPTPGRRLKRQILGEQRFERR